MKYTILIAMSCVFLNACGDPAPTKAEVHVTHPQNKHVPRVSHPPRPVFSGADEKPSEVPPSVLQDDAPQPSNTTEPDSQPILETEPTPEPVDAPQAKPEQPTEPEPQPEPIVKTLIRLSRNDMQASLPDCQDFSNVILESGHVILRLDGIPDSCFVVNTNLIPSLQGRTIKVGRFVQLGPNKFQILSIGA